MAEATLREFVRTKQPTRFKSLVGEIEQVAPAGPGKITADVIATVTLPTIDSDKEIVVPDGVNLTRYRKNPIIMLCHARGVEGDYYPLPIGQALWTQVAPQGIKQGIRFSRTTQMGREVLGLFSEEILRTFSIGFLSDPSPPTKAEIKQHPYWADADLIHRQWELLEVSVVPLPCNEDAIGIYQRKGKSFPSFLWLPDGAAKAKNHVGHAGRSHTEGIMNEYENANGTGDATGTEIEPTEVANPEADANVGEATPHTKVMPFHGSPWQGEEGEKNDAYRMMAHGALTRRLKIMHSGKAGHLYANPGAMTLHYVRHPDDDNDAKGYHNAEQCKGILSSSPNCKGVTVSTEHPEEPDAYERLHPAPDGYYSRSLAESIVKQLQADPDLKAMGEGSGIAGGYAVAGEAATDKGEVVDPAATHNPAPDTSQDKPNQEVKAGHVVQWEEHKGMHAGCGRVKSIHTKGKVPLAYNHAIATEEDPHACVKLFHHKGDNTYEEPDDDDGHHVAVAVKMCKAMPCVAAQSKAMAHQLHAKSVVPYAAGPVSDEAWDAGAAKKRVAKWASSDGSGDKDKIDWAKYEKAFTVCDPDKKEDVGGYHLPHHDIKGGKLVVVKAGVRAALAALGGARTPMKLSESDRAGAEAHLKKHEKEWGGGSESESESESDKSFSPPPFRTRAQVEASIERVIRKSADQLFPSTEEIADEVLARQIGAV